MLKLKCHQTEFTSKNNEDERGKGILVCFILFTEKQSQEKRIETIQQSLNSSSNKKRPIKTIESVTRSYLIVVDKVEDEVEAFVERLFRAERFSAGLEPVLGRRLAVGQGFHAAPRLFDDGRGTHVYSRAVFKFLHTKTTANASKSEVRGESRSLALEKTHVFVNERATQQNFPSHFGRLLKRVATFSSTEPVILLQILTCTYL